MDSIVDVDDILSSPTTQFGRVVVLTSVALCSKFVMKFMNRTIVHNEDAAASLMDRPDGRAIVTVSNHTRCELLEGVVCK